MKDIHSLKWSNYFKEKGHSIVNVHSDGFSFRTIWNLRKTIKQFKPDILHAHYAGAWGLMGALTFFHPFVVTVHGSEVHFTKGIKRRLVKYVLDKADLITADADHTIRKIFKITNEKAKGKTVLVRFGVDVGKFKDLKQYLPMEKVVISLRNHEPIYDVVTLLKAAPFIIEKIPDVKFWIAGTGSLTCDLKEVAKILRIENYVRFVPLHGEDEVIRALNMASLYVSTALADAGIAASTAEAMACELPVLVSDVAENRKWVIYGKKQDQIFKPGDYRELARKAINLLSNDLLANEHYGKMNRKIICALNNYDREMEIMEHYYKEAING